MAFKKEECISSEGRRELSKVLANMPVCEIGKAKPSAWVKRVPWGPAYYHGQVFNSPRALALAIDDLKIVGKNDVIDIFENPQRVVEDPEGDTVLMVDPRTGQATGPTGKKFKVEPYPKKFKVTLGKADKQHPRGKFQVSDIRGSKEA